MTLVLAILLAHAQPVALSQGEAAPFSGVLVSPEHAEQILVEEAQLVALQKQLEAERHVCDAVEAYWRQKYLVQARSVAWYDDPEVNRWGGFVLGFAAGVGVLYGGAYLVRTTGATP